MGLPGKHPANLCQNKGEMNCHNCGGSCTCDAPKANTSADADLVASVTKQVMEQLGLK